LLAQTESVRASCDAVPPSSPDKVCLLPPMIPDDAFASESLTSAFGSSVLELVYAGKFAREWKTLEMLDLPAKLRERGVEARLRVVGEKINRSKTHPDWLPGMRDAIGRARKGAYPGVEIMGALSRAETI